VTANGSAFLFLADQRRSAELMGKRQHISMSAMILFRRRNAW
jgi:hypothetical protein